MPNYTLKVKHALIRRLGNILVALLHILAETPMNSEVVLSSELSFYTFEQESPELGGWVIF